MRYTKRIFAVVAAAALFSLNAATVAAAEEVPAGTPAAAGPDYNSCVLFGTQVADTCFQWAGDKQWIKDNIANGWSGVVQVQTNYGKDRYCQAPPAAEGWAYCDFNHTEGKCVRFRTYELKNGETRNWHEWSKWYGTDYGWPC
jgi:hypothetical protein